LDINLPLSSIDGGASAIDFGSSKYRSASSVVEAPEFGYVPRGAGKRARFVRDGDPLKTRDFSPVRL